jgi:hypothetical protein
MNPPIRHYDFVGKHSLAHKTELLDSQIFLKFPTTNETFTLKLTRNKLLILSDSVLHLHDSLTGDVKISSIVAHPYVGIAIDEYGSERGWARIMFHSE